MNNWRNEWFEFEDVAYLDLAHESPMPRVSIRAAQEAVEWKKFPHRMPQEAYFGLPDRCRTGIAKLIGADPEDVAVTTGASAGLAAIANGIDWNRGGEVLLAEGEFPAHFATFMPLHAGGTLRVAVVKPRDRFITADDFLGRIGPRTRLVSASMVRFNDGSLLDAARVAAACHAAGALFLLDVSQCAGAMPLDIHQLGVDFLVCAGYKWLLSPYGTGFFWARRSRIEEMKPAPAYWTALEGSSDFTNLGRSWNLVPGARRWDAPETSSFFNLAAMAASLEFIVRAGVETVQRHCAQLMCQMIERLPRDRCVLASPSDASGRGPYACIAARSAEKTRALYDKLCAAGVIVSLRQGVIRVSAHLYNTERDIDRLLMALAV